MIAPYVPYSRWRNLAAAANETEQERPAISAGFLGECGFLTRKKASVTIPTQLPGATRAIAKIHPACKYLLARQAEPQVWWALGGCGSLVEVHGGSEGPPQRRIVDAGKVPFEDRGSFRVIERSDRFAHLVAGSAKERWRRRPPLKAARVDLISQSKRRR